MTDRIKGFTVVLAQDVREDDFEAIENVVRMIKGVQSVHRHVADIVVAQRVGPGNAEAIERRDGGVLRAVRRARGDERRGLDASQQRQRVVVVGEAHGLARPQAVQCAEDRGVPEALGYAAGIKRVYGFGCGVVTAVGHGGFLSKI